MMGFVAKFLLLIIVTGHIQQVRGYICAVGRERDEYKVWRWVLPYAYPCGCTRVIMGGMNTDTPKRHFRPVYVDKLLLSDNVGEIRKHYGLGQCSWKVPTFEYCPADQSMETDPKLSTAVASWHSPEAYDILGDLLTITCDMETGSRFYIGETVVVCEARDVKGNEATCSFTIAIKDREAPVFNFCPAYLTAEPTIPDYSAMVVWENLEARDNSEKASTVSCNKGSGGAFLVGHTEVVCEATDESGNTGRCTFTVKVIDAENPTIASIPESVTQNTDSGVATAAVTWTPPTPFDNSGVVILTSSHSSGSDFPIGATTVTYTATDDASNSVTGTFTVTISDREAPVFNICPTNLTAEPNISDSSAIVEWENPEAKDNSEQAPTVSCNNWSGAAIPVGHTEVVCVATDKSGNTGMCTFTVKVIDAEIPTIEFCPTNIIKSITDQSVYTSPSSQVSWDTPVAVDNSGHMPDITCNPISGYEFQVGQTYVLCEAEDGSGNKAYCTFKVEIIDMECYMGNIGRDYRGHKSETINGRMCQKWTAQTPQIHTFTPQQYPLADLGDHNYCRNPDSNLDGPWCYTIDPVSLEYCDVGEPSPNCYTVGCEDGFAFGNICYLIEREAMTWVNAQEHCKINGGYLATVNTQYKQSFLENVIASSDYAYLERVYIGLHVNDAHIEDEWVWDAEDEGGDPATGVEESSALAYSAWNPGEPNSGNEDCVILFKADNYKWHDVECDRPLPSLCQRACDAGWIAFGNMCYFKATYELSWDEAQNDCQGRGGNLASVNTEDKQLFLANWLVGYKRCWIGLNERADVGSWIWAAGDDPGFTWSGGAVRAGGTPLHENTYHAWIQSQPNNVGGNQHCVVMEQESDDGVDNNGQWNDLSCDWKNSYVCQKDIRI